MPCSGLEGMDSRASSRNESIVKFLRVTGEIGTRKR
jgi:hypothetical protein